MMSQSHFQLVGEKTFAEFELALVNLAKAGPFFFEYTYVTPSDPIARRIVELS